MEQQERALVRLCRVGAGRARARSRSSSSARWRRDASGRIRMSTSTSSSTRSASPSRDRGRPIRVDRPVGPRLSRLVHRRQARQPRRTSRPPPSGPTTRPARRSSARASPSAGSTDSIDVIERITTLPDDVWAERVRSHVAQARLYGGYFLKQAVERDDMFLRQHAGLHLSLAAARAALAAHRTLMQGPKYISRLSARSHARRVRRGVGTGRR